MGARLAPRNTNRNSCAAPCPPGHRPEPEHPWLRHPDETARAFAAFRYYRDLGEQRAQVKVQEKFRLSERLVARWSRRVTPGSLRARLWDEHQDRIAVALSTDAIQTMRLEQADCGRAIQTAARKTIDVRMKRWLEGITPERIHERDYDRDFGPSR